MAHGQQRQPSCPPAAHEEHQACGVDPESQERRRRHPHVQPGSQRPEIAGAPQGMRGDPRDVGRQGRGERPGRECQRRQTRKEHRSGERYGGQVQKEGRRSQAVKVLGQER